MFNFTCVPLVWSWWPQLQKCPLKREMCCGWASSTTRCWNRTCSCSRERAHPWACCCSWVFHPESSGGTFTVLWVYQAAWRVMSKRPPNSTFWGKSMAWSPSGFAFSWEEADVATKPGSALSPGEAGPRTQLQAWELMFWRNKTENQLCWVGKSLSFRGVSGRDPSFSWWLQN